MFYQRCNTIKQLFLNKFISIDYIKSKDNITNPLIKYFIRKQIDKSLRGMRLKPIFKELS